MRRILLIALLTLPFVFLTPQAFGGTALNITSGTVDLDADTLELKGSNFDLGGDVLYVSIGGFPLSGCMVDSQGVECPLAGIITSMGTYTVSVSAGNSPNSNDEIDLFVLTESTQMCSSGLMATCYTGDPPIVGECKSGISTCGIDGLWGNCVGEVLPATEDCNSSMDFDCDGLVNYADPDCVSVCTGDGGTICGSECADLLSDKLHCGDCNTECASIEYCSFGSCEIFCPPYMEVCSGGCVDIDSDIYNCGSCGVECGSLDCMYGVCS